MSGSTRVAQTGAWYSVILETPCISFAPPPPELGGEPDGPSQEQRFHAEARAGFEAALAPLAPGLDEALAARAGEAGLRPWAAELQLVGSFEPWSVQRYTDAGGGPCRLAQRLTSPPVGSVGLDGSLELAFDALPAQADAEKLRDDVAATIERLRRRARAAQAGPPTAEFHYVTRPGEDQVEERSGPADGQTVPDGTATLAQAAALARLLAAAEADGAVHPEARAGLDRNDVLVTPDGAEVALGPFGVKLDRRRPPLAPDAPAELNTLELDRQPDWLALQRHALGVALLRLLGGASIDRLGERSEPKVDRAAPPPATASRAGGPPTTTPGEAGWGTLESLPRERVAYEAAVRTRVEAALSQPDLRTLALSLLAFDPAARPTAGAAWRALAALAGEKAPGDGPPPRVVPSTVAARVAAGAFGLLEPCLGCGRPALAGVGVDRSPGGGAPHRPDCCWRARDARAGLLVRLVLAFVVGTALATGALLLFGR